MDGDSTGTKGVRLAIEFGNELHIDNPRSRDRYKSVLVGMLPGQFLLVTLPPVLFREGDSVVVRYLHQGSVFGFRCAVIGTLKQPVKMLCLTYPAQVQEHNIRAAPRLDCFIPCSVTAIVPGAEPADFDPGEPPEEIGETIPEDCLDEPVGRPGLLNDISLTGCQVLFRAQPSDDEALGIDTPVLVSFQVKADEDAFELTGRIRRLGRDSHRVELGIAFDVPAADAYQRIQDYLGPAL